jgi:formylmethanofuran dehydrogenase subunit D
MTLKVTLITGRTVNQGANLENKTSSDYQEATAYCEFRIDTDRQQDLII